MPQSRCPVYHQVPSVNDPRPFMAQWALAAAERNCDSETFGRVLSVLADHFPSSKMREHLSISEQQHYERYREALKQYQQQHLAENGLQEGQRRDYHFVIIDNSEQRYDKAPGTTHSGEALKFARMLNLQLAKHGIFFHYVTPMRLGELMLSDPVVSEGRGTFFTHPFFQTRAEFEHWPVLVPPGLGQNIAQAYIAAYHSAAVKEGIYEPGLVIAHFEDDKLPIIREGGTKYSITGDGERINHFDILEGRIMRAKEDVSRKGIGYMSRSDAGWLIAGAHAMRTYRGWFAEELDSPYLPQRGYSHPIAQVIFPQVCHPQTHSYTEHRRHGKQFPSVELASRYFGREPVLPFLESIAKSAAADSGIAWPKK